MPNIHFELTKSPQHLKDYYQIREACFRTDLLLTAFDGSEDEHDKEGYILIARDGDRCIGGARINGCSPNADARLPIESDDFIVKDLFPDLSLEEHAYCQWTRLALLPEYRTMDTVRQLCLALPKASAELGFKYAFNVAGSARARLYRRILATDGIDYKICNHVTIPAETGFNDLEHLLSIAILEECPVDISAFKENIEENTRRAEATKMAA